MPKRTAPYIADSNLPNRSPVRQKKLAPATVAEPPPPEYHIAPAWIDTAGKTRTWVLKDPYGTQMAEITTKSAAQKLAALLNRVMGDDGPAR